MKLRYDPYQVFRRSKTPAGLYARQKWLNESETQTERGGWGNELAFYQTLNALAHLESPQATRQLEKAFKNVVRTQNTDGTWGQTEPEWNTFLVVHALKSKGIL